jgi:21S rRNA (GM2251-2'-O)-methyltransferase
MFRHFSTWALRLALPTRPMRPAVKVTSTAGPATFDRSFPARKRHQPRPWDDGSVTKDEFFRNKYSHISDEQRLKLTQKVERQRRHRENRREQPAPKPAYAERLRVPRNPLCEYVHGTHAVLAALVANKRALFGALYVHSAKTTPPPIAKLARQYNLKVHEAARDVLNQLLGFGVHNGVVLETKPLEFKAVTALGPCDEGVYKLALRDDLYGDAEVYERHVVREAPYPVGLYLDGLMDPRNVGAIVRSAYFFGVDFVVVPDAESAKLGAVALKASAGALELLDIYKTAESLKFVDASRRNGWVVVSATAGAAVDGAGAAIDPAELAGVCQRAPVLLVMGSEGPGVRTNLARRSDYTVAIAQRRGRGGVVDSLNASVAAALLISKCVEA